MSNIQFIDKDGKREFAVIPYKTYLQMAEDAEIAEDVRDYDEVKAAIEAGDETVPREIVERLLAGDNPVKVWREHRKMTQSNLAERVGITKGYLSQIESGTREGKIDLFRKLAKALELTIDDLVAGE